jgi:Thoeris protein ThsB, TIR-like domain
MLMGASRWAAAERPGLGARLQRCFEPRRDKKRSTGNERAPAYDAFISYSQKGARAIAQALRSVIQTIGKPWWKLRSLHVFLNATSLSATPGLWQGIEAKLDQSRYLILLASSEAANSKWVDVRTFRRDPASAGKGNQAFLHAALDLAATIRGEAKADLYSEEVRRRRRSVRTAYGIATVVAGLGIGAGIATWMAVENAARATQEADRAVRNFGIAKDTVDRIIFDVAQGLRCVEGMRTENNRMILSRVDGAM